MSLNKMCSKYYAKEAMPMLEEDSDYNGSDEENVYNDGPPVSDISKDVSS